MRTAGRVVLLAVLAGCGTPAPIPWQGHALVEVTSLDDLPSAVRSALGASASGLDGIADRGEPFNVSCVAEANSPRRRFLVAGADGETWLVAVERGGRGYSVEVTLFSGRATPQEKWVLLDRPQTLRDVVQQVSQQDGR